MQLRYEIGVDNICWEMDYPHSDSNKIRRPEELDAVFKTYDVPDDEINKMTHENAMKLYHSAPFIHVPKDQATVARCGTSPGPTSKSAPYPTNAPAKKQVSPNSRPAPKKSRAPNSRSGPETALYVKENQCLPE